MKWYGTDVFIVGVIVLLAVIFGVLGVRVQRHTKEQQAQRDAAEATFHERCLASGGIVIPRAAANWNGTRYFEDCALPAGK